MRDNICLEETTQKKRDIPKYMAKELYIKYTEFWGLLTETFCVIVAVLVLA